MTSYKLKPEPFSLSHNSRYSNNLLQDPKPSFALHERQPPSEHRVIINEINLKNQALKGHNLQKPPKVNTSHPNYLTFCQQYTQMLFNKYNPQEQIELNHSHLNQENSKPKNINQDMEQKISLNLIAYKRFFETAQFDFEKDYEHLMMKIKHLTKALYARNSAFAQKDQTVDEELMIMELFMSKINTKLVRESSKIPCYFVTPFTVFVEEKKKGRKTPERQKVSKDNKSSLHYYDKKDFVKGDVQGNEKLQNQQQIQKTKTFLVSPKSPDLLLQSFNDQFVNSEENLNDMFVSFNQNSGQNHHHYSKQDPHQRSKGMKAKNESKMMQSSQIIGDTLKYSESELMGTELLNIDLVNGSVEYHESSIQNQLRSHEILFSPVQPYRLHKLYNQANLNKIHTSTQQNTHKTDQFDEPQLFLETQENTAFKNILTEIQTSFHASVEPIKYTAQKLYSALSHTQTDVTQIVAQSHVLLSEQKTALNQDWEDVLRYISKDIAQLQQGIALDKQENDMKDKKFLENLEIVQNELIEQIFQEKECRKAEQNVLTQVLSNLVQNLQNNYV